MGCSEDESKYGAVCYRGLSAIENATITGLIRSSSFNIAPTMRDWVWQGGPETRAGVIEYVRRLASLPSLTATLDYACSGGCEIVPLEEGTDCAVGFIAPLIEYSCRGGQLNDST
jgi:hypothetical protein